RARGAQRDASDVSAPAGQSRPHADQSQLRPWSRRVALGDGTRRVRSALVRPHRAKQCVRRAGTRARFRVTRKGPAMKKHTIRIWYDKDAEAAALFYAATFPDSVVGTISRAPSDFPSGKAGDVITVEFTVAGVPCLGLNGGPMFKHSEAFSFQIATDDPDQTDRYWNAIVGHGRQGRAVGPWQEQHG